MYFLIYTSYATFSEEIEMKTLLLQAREKNKKKDITGMLLYLNGIFIQLMEGNKSDVLSLYLDIRKDKRHKDVVMLKDGLIENRYFTNWSMGFKAISDEELLQEEGYRSLNLTSKPDLNEALKIFKLLSQKREQQEL